MFEFEREHKKSEIPIEDFFIDADIVILGETHHGTHTHEILSILEKCADTVAGLFIELPISLQKDVDTYMQTGEITSDLDAFFKGAEREGKHIEGLLDIFDVFTQNGKSVICIDSSKRQTGEYAKRSPDGYYFLKGKSRDEDMFSVIKDRYTDVPGKYLAIVGAGHIEPTKHHRTGEDTLELEMQNFSGKYISAVLSSE